MYTHILVPLDGSELAEQVLPHAKMLAAVNPHTHITLLRAIPPIYPIIPEYGTMPLPPTDEAAMATIHQDAQSYLNTIANTLQSEGYHTNIVVSNFPAAEAIVEYADNNDVKLIAIASHGRGGISQWVFGSVTHKVLHGTKIPVLVVRPTLD